MQTVFSTPKRIKGKLTKGLYVMALAGGLLATGCSHWSSCGSKRDKASYSKCAQCAETGAKCENCKKKCKLKKKHKKGAQKAN